MLFIFKHAHYICDKILTEKSIYMLNLSETVVYKKLFITIICSSLPYFKIKKHNGTDPMCLGKYFDLWTIRILRIIAQS